MMKKIFTLILLINLYSVSAQNITWTNVTTSYNMPIGVQVFSGVDASIPLKVKYIDIDLNNTDLELTPVLSASPTHARNWAKNLGAIATMNGGYFAGGTSLSAVVNTTVEAKNVAALTRASGSYPVTRGFFGINTDGSMAVDWIYHFGNNKTDIYSYAVPNPNTNGIPAPTPTQAGGTPLTNLAKGMGAGPVLIKNGTIVDSYTEEVFWDSGVSNTGLDPRSAMGYTANKHVILLVADGRQPGISAGASIPQMASILKNLGCEGALNFDGGGSTQLATPDTFINTPSESYRSVPSVWAVYKKANLETPVPTIPIDQSSTDSSPIKLVWNMPTEMGTTYRLQIATSKDNWNKQVGFTPNATTNSTVLVNEDVAIANYYFSNLTLGNTYYWTVVAQKTGGFKSYYSDPVSFKFTNGVEIDWKRSDSNNNKPTWFGADSERGLAYANNKVYVASRSNGSTKVKILNCFDGTDLGELPITDISGGTFPLNDIEASSNGMLLGCNLTTNTGVSNFKVYKWVDDTTDPVIFIDYTSPSNLRLGDKFTVIGDISTNAAIYAAAGAGTKVVRWLVINGVLQIPTEITLSAALGNQPSVIAFGTSDDSDMIVNSVSKNAILYSSTGVNKGPLENTIIDSDSNALKYFELDGKKYLAVFQSKQTPNSPIGNNCRIIDITNGFTTASIVATTDRLGNSANGNGTGDIDLRFTTSPVSLVAFTLATNNGVSGTKIFGEVIANGSSNNTLAIKQNHQSRVNPVTIYPNPASTELMISTPDFFKNNSFISIFSLDGKKIQSEPLINNFQIININNLSNGIYIIKVENGQQHYYKKFIKS